MEGFTYVYVDHVGPYKTVGKAFDKLQAELAAAGMDVSWDRHRFVGACDGSTPSITPHHAKLRLTMPLSL